MYARVRERERERALTREECVHVRPIHNTKRERERDSSSSIVDSANDDDACHYDVKIRAILLSRTASQSAFPAPLNIWLALGMCSVLTPHDSFT